MMDRLSVCAEQALLGAVLSDPERQQGLLDWVEAGDMCRPWHAQVLEAMQRLRQRGVPPGPLEVYAELQHDPDLPVGVARDAVPLANLMGAVPMGAVPRAGHARHYAVMVAERGIRQRLKLAGSRMAQAAESGDLAVALRQVCRARHELGALRARWSAFPGPLRHEVPALARAGQGDAEIARRVVALPEDLGWSLGGSRPRGQAAEAAGRRALRDLAAGSSRITRVHGWLQPEYFARSEHGALYEVMRDLDAAGVPADPITITWEAARRGIQADPADLSGGTAGFAVASAREVRRHGLLAQVICAGTSLQADATDVTCHPGRLLQETDRRLHVIESQAQPEPAIERSAVVALARGGAQTEQPYRQPDREAVP
jgi:replicative DNA helicase